MNFLLNQSITKKWYPAKRTIKTKNNGKLQSNTSDPKKISNFDNTDYTQVSIGLLGATLYYML